ncbi:MAG: ATP synthase F1 subunit epsilon [Spirochaetaceae bacterium]|jgi:F-type H+-transporting ATPase subunit epsilon|nr:ATP synthase F1 subunit epsilon [Spirochaetaceae bacterium]
MAVLFPFEVHTPYRPFFSDKVEAVSLTLADGEVGIYANHSPFIAPVVTGILRLKDKNGEWRSAFISNGIIEVKKRKAVLVTDTAEWPSEIDRERAEASGKQAEADLSAGAFKFEVAGLKEKVRRSRFRLKVAGEMRKEE